MNEFWKKYIKSDKLGRHKLLDTLPITKSPDGFYKGFTTTLLQSYLDDLLSIAKEKGG